jgi:hypothetical protein
MALRAWVNWTMSWLYKSTSGSYIQILLTGPSHSRFYFGLSYSLKIGCNCYIQKSYPLSSLKILTPMFIFQAYSMGHNMNNKQINSVSNVWKDSGPRLRLQTWVSEVHSNGFFSTTHVSLMSWKRSDMVKSCRLNLFLQLAENERISVHFKDPEFLSFVLISD